MPTSRYRRAIKARTTTRKHCKEQKTVSCTTSVGIIERILPGCEKPIKCIGIRNKEARFNNRRRPKGWLTPTANHLLQTHINVVKKLQKFLPITQIVLEVNKFAFMELDNPNIQKWQYAKDQLYQYGGVKEAVSEQQGSHCLLCKSAIDHYHHIVPKSKGGRDTIANIAGVCEKHHLLVHTKIKWQKKMVSKKKGLNKKYGALSVLNQIIPKLTVEYTNMLDTKVTTGRETAKFRQAYGIEKAHHSDAYCIACSVLDEPTSVITEHNKFFLLRQFRRHDRKACIQEMINRKYLLNGEVVATNRHKAIEQKAISLDEYCFVGGVTGCLRVKKHPAIYQRSNRIMPGAVFTVRNKSKVMEKSKGLHNGKPDYFYFTDGSKAAPSKCCLIRRNEGIVFV